MEPLTYHQGPRGAAQQMVSLKCRDGSKAVFSRCPPDFRYGSNSGVIGDTQALQLGATTGSELMQQSVYSIDLAGTCEQTFYDCGSFSRSL